MIGKMLTAVVILTIFIMSQVHCVPPFQQPGQQPGISATSRLYSSNSNANLESTTPIPIVTQSDLKNDDGSFNFSYEAGNGIKQQSSGFHKKVLVPSLRSDGTDTGEQHEADILVHTGSYSYTDPDGNVITLNYVADENGFQPVGDHLPTPPPIPDHVLALLRQQSEQQGDNQAAQRQTPQPPQPNGFGRSPQAQRF